MSINLYSACVGHSHAQLEWRVCDEAANWLYRDRAVGGHRNHQRSDRTALTSRAVRARGRKTHSVHEQPQANGAGIA